MAGRVSTKDILDRPKGGGNFPSLSELLVDLKVTATSGPVERRLRPIGFPISFREHSNKIKNADGKTFTEVPFPDEALSKNKYTRICTENDPKHGPCHWCSIGYTASTKYALIAIQYEEDGTMAVKILNKGATIFDQLAEGEMKHAKRNKDKGREAYSTFLGGEKGHQVLITATHDARALGKVKYSVDIDPDVMEITAEEIALLELARKPSAEELAAIYEADPELRDYPAWMTYGPEISKIFKPHQLKTDEATTPSAHLNITGAGDVVEAAAAPAAPKTSKQPPAAAPADGFLSDAADVTTPVTEAGGKNLSWE